MSERLRGTVRCDADGCGWEQGDVFLSDWVGKPCPLCDVELLNDSDVAMIVLAEAAIIAGIVKNASSESDSPYKFRVNTDRRRFAASNGDT